jgi:hypothetical protein
MNVKTWIVPKALLSLYSFWGMLTVPKAIAPSPIGMREMQEIQQQTQLQAQEGGAAEEQPAEDKPAGDDNA